MRAAPGSFTASACTRSARCRRAPASIIGTSGRHLHAEALGVVGGPARRRDLDARARSRRRASAASKSGSFHTVISSGAPIVFVQVAFGDVDGVADRRQLAVGAGLRSPDQTTS